MLLEEQEDQGPDYQAVLQDCKKGKSDLAIAWIDYKKAYDSVLDPWIMGTRRLIIMRAVEMIA